MFSSNNYPSRRPFFAGYSVRTPVSSGLDLLVGGRRIALQEESSSRGIPLRGVTAVTGETSSGYCGGRPGVSSPARTDLTSDRLKA